MGKRTRQATKAETRGALIAAGIHEFGAHGFDVSLDAICARAKRTRGAFYIHFADRDAFIASVMEHVLDTFVAAITTSDLHIDTSIALFFAAVRSRAPIVSGGSGLHFHHILEACQRSKRIGTAYRMSVLAARDQLAKTAPARADLLIAVALGVTAAMDLHLDLDLHAIERAIRR
jgi:TetR/AcrR family transcriptional regulator, transcriptional repressor for nem operon